MNDNDNYLIKKKKKLLITHPTFLLASSSEMRLDRVQVDLWHRRLDVVNIEAACNSARALNVRTFCGERKAHDRPKQPNGNQGVSEHRVHT